MSVKLPLTYKVVPERASDLTVVANVGWGSKVASTAPVVPSSFASPWIVDCAPMVVKSPPTYSDGPETSSADGALFMPGSNGSSAPLPGANAAIRERGWPAAWMKPPPAYTAVSVAASAVTPLSVPGFHGVSAPLPASSAASRLRVSPTTENCPPTVTFVPSAAIAFPGPPIGLPAAGAHAVGVPVVRSIAARRRRGCPPIVLKAPATYTVFPETARLLTAPPARSRVPPRRAWRSSRRRRRARRAPGAVDHGEAAPEVDEVAGWVIAVTVLSAAGSHVVAVRRGGHRGDPQSPRGPDRDERSAEVQRSAVQRDRGDLAAAVVRAEAPSAAFPVVGSRRATSTRLCAPMVLKFPPANTAPPPTASAFTAPLELGANARSRAPSRRVDGRDVAGRGAVHGRERPAGVERGPAQRERVHLARRGRAGTRCRASRRRGSGRGSGSWRRPRRLKLPPTYQPPAPSATIARTVPLMPEYCRRATPGDRVEPCERAGRRPCDREVASEEDLVPAARHRVDGPFTPSAVRGRTGGSATAGAAAISAMRAATAERRRTEREGVHAVAHTVRGGHEMGEMRPAWFRIATASGADVVWRGELASSAFLVADCSGPRGLAGVRAGGDARAQHRVQRQLQLPHQRCRPDGSEVQTRTLSWVMTLYDDGRNVHKSIVAQGSESHRLRRRERRLLRDQPAQHALGHRPFEIRDGAYARHVTWRRRSE